MTFAQRIGLTKTTITLRDLAKPSLGRQEKAAINRALKGAQKDQEKIKKQAKLV